MTGKSPYSLDMARVVHSFAASETANNAFFHAGDSCTRTFSPRVSFDAIISAYLHNDPIALSVAKSLGYSYSRFSYSAETPSPTEFFICMSGGVMPVQNYREALDKVLYNGGFIGQLITRSSWSPDAAMTSAKIQPRTGSNHDHQACGHFQIYYKGLTSGPSGVYASYNSTHWSRYYQETVSKNGLLIFDPSEKNSQGGWYSGGQRTNGAEPANLESWQSGSYDRAEVTGFASGYTPDASGAKFAYLAGDITKAYSASRASYVGRSMLTVYTKKLLKKSLILIWKTR
jgi:hypothetical protein